MFYSMYMAFEGAWVLPVGDANFANWFATKVGAAYHPFGILRLLGEKVPPEELWWATRYMAEISTVCAIVGFLTRPAMVVSTISVMLLVLLQISESYFWSHTYNVIFLAAIPFSLCNAGSSLSVDRFINKFWPAYPFGRRTEPVLWGVLAGQASVALFLFGAFWAKIYTSIETAGWLGPWYYIVSDNMRNILGIFWMGTPENIPPPWIVWGWSYPIVWQAMILGHLLMQGVPILALISLQRPVARLAEGALFLGGIIALGFVANGWNWAWIPLAAFFVDWDHYLRVKPRVLPPAPKPLWAVWVAICVFFAIYMIGLATQRANGWGLYPFSNMNFYAALYVHPPYNEHRPYADYMIGEVTIQPAPGQTGDTTMPKHWQNVTGKGWAELGGTPYRGYRMVDGQITMPFRNNNLHGIGREMDLDRLRSSLKHSIGVLSLGPLPPGTRVISWLKTSGFPAYPEPMSKKTLHGGIRGIWEPSSDRFVGLSTKLDRNTGLLSVTDARGEVSSPTDRMVFARFSAHRYNDVLPLVPVPGRWVDDKTYQIEASFLKMHSGKLLNSIIRTATDFGIIDFDGPVQWL